MEAEDFKTAREYSDYLWTLYRDTNCIRCGREIGYMHQKGISPPVLCTDLNGNFGCQDLVNNN